LRKEDRPEKGAAVDFRFTEEQKMIQEMAKGFFDGNEPSGGIWQLPNREGQLQAYIPQPEAFGGIPKKDGGKKKNLDLLKRRFHPHPECGKRIEE
jgi:hypothetical protein